MRVLLCFSFIVLQPLSTKLKRIEILGLRIELRLLLMLLGCTPLLGTETGELRRGPLDDLDLQFPQIFGISVPIRNFKNWH